jgi:uncharacterized protein (TIGR02453 family)
MDFKNAFTFLGKLAKNNNREWFEKNKQTFLGIKSDFEGFVTGLYDLLLVFDESIAGQDPKKFVFRIYRDVRFSKDKKPYKKFISAGISSEGKGMGKPGYYLQLEPGNKSILCTGLFAPPPEILAKVRQEIDYNGESLSKIINEKSFKKHFGEFWNDDKLKTAPKGYAKDHPYVDWLKLKSFVLLHRFTDEEVFDKRFQKKVAEIIKAGKPLNDFLSSALE